MTHVQCHVPTCYDTWFMLYFSFDLLVHYRGDKRTIFQGKRRAHLLLTRTTTNYRVRWPRFCPGSCNDAGANFRESSTRGCKLFNHSISDMNTYAWMRLCVCACAGSRGFATTRACNLCGGQRQRPVWENITAGSSGWNRKRKRKRERMHDRLETGKEKNILDVCEDCTLQPRT